MQAFLIPVLRPSKSTVLCFKSRNTEHRQHGTGKGNSELRMKN